MASGVVGGGVSGAACQTRVLVRAVAGGVGV